MAPVAAKMAEELNATETIFPGSKLHKVFKLVQVEIRRLPCSEIRDDKVWECHTGTRHCLNSGQ